MVQIRAWCRRATNHSTRQCWSSSMSPYGVTGTQRVQEIIQECSNSLTTFVTNLALSYYLNHLCMWLYIHHICMLYEGIGCLLHVFRKSRPRTLHFSCWTSDKHSATDSIYRGIHFLHRCIFLYHDAVSLLIWSGYLEKSTYMYYYANIAEYHQEYHYENLLICHHFRRNVCTFRSCDLTGPCW